MNDNLRLFTDPTADPWDGRRLIDIETLARWLGVTVRHVRRLVAEKRIPYVKVGHLVRFDRTEIEAWIEGCRRPAVGPQPPTAATVVSKGRPLPARTATRRPSARGAS